MYCLNILVCFQELLFLYAKSDAGVDFSSLL